jgi:hypothetical protein
MNIELRAEGEGLCDECAEPAGCSLVFDGSSGSVDLCWHCARLLVRVLNLAAGPGERDPGEVDP